MVRPTMSPIVKIYSLELVSSVLGYRCVGRNCSNPAKYQVNILTLTQNGKRILNKVRYCTLPGKYCRWDLPRLGEVYKIYELIPVVDSDYCMAEMYDGYDGVDVHGRRAAISIGITTLTPLGKMRHNKSTLCTRHISRRYKQWWG